MSQQITSHKPVVSNAPRFRVDGRRVPEMTIDLVELEAAHDERGMATLEFSLVNWGRSEDGREDFLYFGDSTVQLGARLVVEAGEDDASAEIFQGQITSIGAQYGEQMPPLLVVRAEDELQQLRVARHSRVFEDATDGGIVRQIASERGVQADVQAEGSKHRAYWQLNRSDLAVLRERAEAADATLVMEDGALVFRPLRQRDQEPIELTWFDELLSFEADADLAHQRTEVHVHGYSVADKRGIHEWAGAEAARAEAQDGRLGAEWLEELDLQAEEHIHLESPASEQEARQLAEALARARARRFVRGHGKTVGTPRLKAGRPIELKGLGGFDGVYDLASVRHTFDRAVGFRTYFSAERVDFGGQP
jgi:uncharacterized protein